MSNKPLIVMALQSEGQGVPESLGYDVLYCGVGKVNAAYHLTRALGEARAREYAYPFVLNLGSAGSPRFATGSLVAAHQFLQRDMDATGLGFTHAETPFDDTPRLLSFPKRFDALPHGLCSSGDSFLQTACPVQGEIIDMEAYALAKVCLLETIPFACAKYITDGADGAAHNDWQENLKHAAEAFSVLLNELLPDGL